jgi:hypothetical protein
MTDTMDLHRVPLLAARGGNAATVKLACCRLQRQMRGPARAAVARCLASSMR